MKKKKKNLFKVLFLALFVMPILMLVSCKNNAKQSEVPTTKLSNELVETPQARATANEVFDYNESTFVGKTFSIMFLKNGSMLHDHYMGEDLGWEDERDEEAVKENLVYLLDDLSPNQRYLSEVGGSLYGEIRLVGQTTGDSYSIYATLTQDYYSVDIKHNNETKNIIYVSGYDSINYDLSYVFPERVEVILVSSLLDGSSDMGIGPVDTNIISDYGLESTLNQYMSYYMYQDLDIEKPDFEKNDYNFPVNVDSPESIESILSKIHATDETDGDVSSRVQLVSTTYDSDNLVLGKHDLNVKVSDAAGNIRTGTFKITVFDIVKPVIQGINHYDRSYDDEISVDTVLNALTATDNFTTNLTIILKHNTYTDNASDIGNYDMVFTVLDEALNISDDFIVTFAVKDEKAPALVGPTTIELSNQTQFTETELRSKYTAHDEYDGDVELQITDFDKYSNAYQHTGVYFVKISVSDSSNNSVSLNVALNVKDTKEPDFYVFKDYVISIAKGTELTKDMIISYLSQLGEVEANNVQEVSFELDNETVGLYEVSLLMLDGSTYECSIQVGDIEKTNTDNFWESTWEHFKDNIIKPQSWNWLNYTAVIALGVIVIAVVVLFFKMKKKSGGKK